MLNPISITLYLAATGLLSWCLFFAAGNNHAKPRHWVAVAFAALALHGLLLHQSTFAGTDINLGFFNAISLSAWLIALTVVSASALRQPLDNLALFALPLAALGVLLSALYPGIHLLPREQGAGPELHVATSLFAYSILTIAALQSVLLAVQERRLRNHRPGHLRHILPPLQVQESLLIQFIAVGFSLLSLSLLSGFMFLEDLFAQHLIHKTVLSAIAWLVFAILLLGRWRFGWRGPRLARWSLSGFSLLMLAYFGSKLVLELLLEQS